MRRILLPLFAATAAAMALAGCSEKTESLSDAGIGADADWSSVGGAADETGYSRLQQINTRNAGDLGLQWALDLPGEVTLAATPLAVDGVLYFSGSHAAVYAVNGATGELLWHYDPESWKYDPDRMPSYPGVNRGVAYEDGRIFVGAPDGRLIALDATTGMELWVARSIPKGALNIGIGAPRVMNGKVIIGNGGSDSGARGFVSAFDARTGKRLWRFYTTPGSPRQNRGNAAMEMAAKTWSEDFWKATGGGATVSNGITFDPELNRIYIGTDNAGPEDPEMRSPDGGDNLFASSIVALDADTGKYIWHYQENPRESWGYKATPNVIAATLSIEGTPRKVLMHAPTNGFFYVLDRETGKLISARETTAISWASGIDSQTGRPIEEPNIRYENGSIEIWPGSVGGHDWQAMSYNPILGLVFIPVQQIGTRFTRSREENDTEPSAMELSMEPVVQKPGDGKGYLVAWDPVSQKQAWRIKHEELWNGGTLTTAGGLVFQGTADGWFNAYNGKTGERLWRFDAGLGIVAAPMSYRIGEKQYVSVLVGYGGTHPAFGEFMNAGWKYGAQPRRLLTFAVGGTGKLPPSPPADKAVHALDDPDLVLNEEDIAAGMALSARCAACHGVGFHSTGTPGPDLTESEIALQIDSFSDYLQSNARIDRGMPRYDTLSDDEIRQLYSYIRARAREALKKRKENEVPPPMPRQ